MARQYVSHSGYVVNETGSAAYVSSRGTVVQETESSGTTPVSASLACSYGVHAAVSQSLGFAYTVESASLTVSANLAGSYQVLQEVSAELAGVSIIVIGTGTASFTTDAWGNNTTAPREGASVSYSWYPAGRVGSLQGITPVEGTGVLDAQNRLTAPNLPGGAGIFWGVILGATPAEDEVFYQSGTAA